MKKTLIIITGASKGLGKGLLSHFCAEPNHELIAIARSQIKASEQVRSLQLDLSDSEKLEQAIPEIFADLALYDRIVLINNAGWIGPVKKVGKLSVSDWQKLFAINVTACMQLMNAFVKYCGTLSSERIVINISSGAGKKPLDGWAAYCSSKAALDMLTQVAAQEAELTGSGIRFFALAPGIVDTDMQSDIRSASADQFSSLDRFLSYKSEGKLASPAEVAEKIAYLINHTHQFPSVLQDVRQF